jgi:hypothetical protein
MAQEYSRESRSPGRSGFVPLLLLALAMLLLVGSQTSQLLQQKTNLTDLRSGQDAPLDESRKVREQFESIAKGTARLASQGNENARALLKNLRALGIVVGKDQATIN